MSKAQRMEQLPKICALAKRFIEYIGTQAYLDELHRKNTLKNGSKPPNTQELFLQSQGFLYRSLFILLHKPKLDLSKKVDIWKHILQNMEKISFQKFHLWKQDTCDSMMDMNCDDISIRMLWEELEEQILVLTSEKFGQMHEFLLGLTPKIHEDQLILEGTHLNKRKTTGAFYTPSRLIDIVLQATLEPIIQKNIEICGETEEALLQIRVCDPSCGTGNFVIHAMHRLGHRLLQIRLKQERVEEQDYQHLKYQAICDVIEHCIYGVDINALSVDVCILSLWMETQKYENIDIIDRISEKNILCGNALMGVTPEQIQEGIKNEYFDCIKDHDDKNIRKKMIKKNQQSFRMSDSSIHEQVQRKKHAVSEKDIADILIATTVWPKTSDPKWLTWMPYHSLFEHIKEGSCENPKEMQDLVQLLRNKHQFFHWHVEFKDVFEKGGFDVVIGNPPYLDSEYLKKYQPRQRVAISHLYTSAKGNWDLFVPFTELGYRITKENGMFSFVTPNKMIGADYTQALHQIFFSSSLQEIHDFSQLSKHFFLGARVAVVVIVLQKKKAEKGQSVTYFQYTDMNSETRNIVENVDILKKLPAGYISFPITSPNPNLIHWLNCPIKISDIATVSDGMTTGEAYELRNILLTGSTEDLNNSSKIKLVNTGTIDPFQNLWSLQKIKYLGFVGECPVIDADTLKQVLPKRYAQSQKTKIVVAGMSNRIEAVVVPKSFLCGKSAVQIIPHDGICPYVLCCFLNSIAYTYLYQGLFSMRGMGGSSMNIGPRQIEQLPIPYSCTSHDQSIIQNIKKLSEKGKEIHNIFVEGTTIPNDMIEQINALTKECMMSYLNQKDISSSL